MSESVQRQTYYKIMYCKNLFFSKHLFSSDISMCVCLHICARVCRCTKGSQLGSTCEAHHVAFLLCFISETGSLAALEIHQFPRTNGRVRPWNLFISALTAQTFVPPPSSAAGIKLRSSTLHGKHIID